MSQTLTKEKHTNSDSDKNQMRGAASQGSEHTYQATFAPRFDIWEGDDELILYGDLPGVDSSDLDIQFENHQLTIHGKVCGVRQGVTYVREEYKVGDFYRTFMIGESINSEAIAAELHDGVLKLHLPKSDAAKPRRIEVKAG